jgi:hypothetical protein
LSAGVALTPGAHFKEEKKRFSHYLNIVAEGVLDGNRPFT